MWSCVELNFELKTLLEHGNESLEYNYFLRFEYDFNSPVDISRVYAKNVWRFLFLAYYVLSGNALFVQSTSHQRLRKRNNFCFFFTVNTINDMTHTKLLCNDVLSVLLFPNDWSRHCLVYIGFNDFTGVVQWW